MNNLSREAKYCVQKLIDNEHLDRKEWQLILSLAEDSDFSHYFAKQQAIHDSVIGMPISSEMMSFHQIFAQNLSAEPSLPEKTDSFEMPIMRAINKTSRPASKKKGA